MKKGFKLNLDDLFATEFFYTKYDIGDDGHSITIKEEDKQKFLNEFSKIWKKRTEEYLEEIELDQYNNIIEEE